MLLDLSNSWPLNHRVLSEQTTGLTFWTCHTETTSISNFWFRVKFGTRTSIISSSVAPPGGQCSHHRIRDRLYVMLGPMALPGPLVRQHVGSALTAGSALVGEVLPLTISAGVSPCQASLSKLWKGDDSSCLPHGVVRTKPEADKVN